MPLKKNIWAGAEWKWFFSLSLSFLKPVLGLLPHIWTTTWLYYLRWRGWTKNKKKSLFSLLISLRRLKEISLAVAEICLRPVCVVCVFCVFSTLQWVVQQCPLLTALNILWPPSKTFLWNEPFYGPAWTPLFCFGGVFLFVFFILSTSGIQMTLETYILIRKSCF